VSGKKHSIGRDGQAIAFHYDLSNEFYAAWLDKKMVFSCAYFPNSSKPS
jgi:cyclopropane-fatty-acyl-phospholipid synthase